MKKIIILLSIGILFLFPLVFALESSQVSFSLLEYDPNPIQPGQVLDLYIQLDNKGQHAGKGSLEIIEEYPFTIEQTQDYLEAKQLESIGFSRKLHFRVRVANDAKDGLTPLRIRYADDSYSKGSYLEKTFDIYVRTFDARLDLIKMEQIPSRLEPGEEGELLLTLANNDDRPLNNIDVTLDLTHSFDSSSNMDNMISVQSMINSRLEDINRRVASGLSPLNGATPMMNGGSGMGAGELSFKAFSFIDSTNQRTISTLYPGESAQISFPIMALPNTLPNSYATPLFLNYNDEENNPFHLRLNIPLIVDTEPELYVDLSSTSLRTTDFAAQVEFTVANRGLTELRYVTLELLEDESLKIITAPKSIYLGNLAPGEFTKGTFTVLSESEELSFQVKTEYRDSFNKKHENLKSIPFTIINKNYYRDLPYEMWISWIILGIVLLLLTAFFVHQMSKKRNI